MNVYFSDRNTLFLSRPHNHVLFQRNEVIARPIATSASFAGNSAKLYDNARTKLESSTKLRGYLTEYRQNRTLVYYGFSPLFAGIDSLFVTGSKYILPQLQKILADCNGDMNHFMEIIAEKEMYYLSNPEETIHIIITKIINNLTYSYYYTTSMARFLIKSILEESAVNFLPHKYADKLTKSVMKSYIRKVSRFNNRFLASYRLVKTYIYANLITEISFACIETFADNLLYPLYSRYYPSPSDKADKKVAKKGNVVIEALPVIARSLFHRSVNLVLYSIIYSLGCTIHVFPSYNCGNILVFAASIMDPSRILFGAFI